MVTGLTNKERKLRQTTALDKPVTWDMGLFCETCASTLCDEFFYVLYILLILCGAPNKPLLVPFTSSHWKLLVLFHVYRKSTGKLHKWYKQPTVKRADSNVQQRRQAFTLSLESKRNLGIWFVERR